MSYLDGTYANAKLTGNVISYPLVAPNNSSTKLYTLTFTQSAVNYADANLGSTNTYAPNAYLVEKSPVEKIGAGLIKFQHTYCELPALWVEAQQIVYTYPGASSGTGFNYSRYGLRNPSTVPKLATITHEYILSNTVPTANISPVTIVTLYDQPVDWIGEASAQDNNTTTPSTDPAVWTVASDPRLWMGTIWEVITQNITGPNTFV